MMNFKTNFDDEWKYWIWHNVNRGCPKKEIFDILLKNGFCVHTIKNELNFDPVTTLQNSKVVEKLRSAKNVTQVHTDQLELFTISNFLDESQCERVIDISKNNFHRSTVTMQSSDKYFRTSSTCSFERCNNERDISFINSIDKKICDTLGIDSSFSEPIQAQRYTVTQQFKPHTDFFSEDEYDEHCVYQGNRTWTFMIYLNTVQEGGETYMCKINKKFIPQSGTALIWNNLNQNGRGNENTLHSGEPVLKGSKYIITKWFRQKSASAAVEPVG